MFVCVLAHCKVMQRVSHELTLASGMDAALAVHWTAETTCITHHPTHSQPGRECSSDFISLPGHVGHPAEGSRLGSACSGGSQRTVSVAVH